MGELTLVINDTKTGKSYAKKADLDIFTGMKVGSELDGNLIGLEGYKFLISGGSDDAGFPMRKDIDGSRKKKILAGKTIGVKKLNGARRIKKLVAGNLVYERTSQLNLKIIKVGKASLEEQTEEKTE